MTIACSFKRFVTFYSLFVFAIAKSVLFVHDLADEDLNKYTVFTDYLSSENNYDVTIVNVKNNGVKVLSDDKQTNLFDELIFAPFTMTKIKGLTEKNIMHFYENGGNIMVMGSPKQSNNNPVRKFLNNIGIYPSPKNYVTKDFEADEETTLVLNKGELFLNNYIFNNNLRDKTVSFEESSSCLIDTNEMIFPIIRQSDYMKNFNDENIWALSNQGYLAVAFQNLNNNRVSWIGSDSVFNDDSIFEQDNYDFIKSVTKWTFQEKAMLKVLSFDHYQVANVTSDVNEDSNSEVTLSFDEEPYKVKDTVVVDLYVELLDDVDKDGNEVYNPFEADDIQFELRMIDPYYRINLSKDLNDNKRYSTGKFALPDQFGIFTFAIKYYRKGLSYIDVKDIKAIRHFAHSEYPRSYEIRNSWVYLCTVGSVIAIWIAFVIMFITTSKRVRTQTISKEKKVN
ncbi:related to Dolichyl-diphosphooligosaccharide--protein glycosyltransferase subunit WBP1 [Hanseniaspora guilliermondii]|uniref:Dolichyl-diphosphooligosaccharide--protein glycosyltransferase subunit WBP1 n=1 Tax=Hanseniaspora guilliermondii TaxID=56406 RepID=A0A1L0AW73_9ASCO|nr:related to Dolichyl-diphosphooligosaccharide--protein glycosyltransferase subunit WBP1 [Hanseniaspora guilliermondii]